MPRRPADHYYEVRRGQKIGAASEDIVQRSRVASEAWRLFWQAGKKAALEGDQRVTLWARDGDYTTTLARLEVR